MAIQNRAAVSSPYMSFGGHVNTLLSGIMLGVGECWVVEFHPLLLFMCNIVNGPTLCKVFVYIQKSTQLVSEYLDEFFTK